MIDIQPYLTKLDSLREYMGLVIDERLPRSMVEIDFRVLMEEPISPDELIRLFRETGILYYRQPTLESSSLVRAPTFDEYLSHIKQADATHR